MGSLAYLEELNEIQRKAVTTIDGPVMVIAGPGSGKTRVLTYRIAHIINQGINPSSILALTFTNKAAKEMKERIEKVVGPKANWVWAGTFHSIFARILRTEAEKLGYPSSFTIYDGDDSKSLINTIIKEMNLDKEKYNANIIRSRISSAKSNIIPPSAYARDAGLMEEDRKNNRPATQQIYAKYVLRCKQAGAMDFDDLLYYMYILLVNNPENVREKYREKFRYLLVDEFQDTNFLQYQIIRELVDYPQSPRNICIVGDDAQSIYAFRGATIDNILEFGKHFKDLKTFKLEQNYRSTDHIVQAANDIIQYNRKQIKKEIWTDKKFGQKIKIIRLMSDADEGKRIADLILELRNREHIPYREIAVLYRTNAQSRIFEEYLRRYNMIYRVFGGLSFYQRKEVKDLLAYMRLAVNPRDEEALKRVINYPRRGIGDTTVDRIVQFAGDNGISVWDALTVADAGSRSAANLQKFKQLIESFIQIAAVSTADKAAEFIVRNCGIMAELTSDKTVEGISRLENANALMDGIKAFVENDVVVEGEIEEDRSLTSYIQNISLLTDQDEKSEEKDYITLMSIHAAKGLEFDCVFVVGLEENLFPSFMSLETPGGLDEERRLFYVAITRARKHLTLSYALNRYRFGKLKQSGPSRFLEEIDPLRTDSNVPITRQAPDRQTTSSVSGFFAKPKIAENPPWAKTDADFKASPSSQIQAGMKVLHQRFGVGNVVAIDGNNDNRVATIFFEGSDEPNKRIMLKFAKLQVLN